MLGRALIERGRTAWLNGDPAAGEADLNTAIQELNARGQIYDLARAAFLLAALWHEQRRPRAEAAWLSAANQIVKGGYAYLLDEERTLAYPMIAAYLESADAEVAEQSRLCVAHLQHVVPPPLRVHMLGGLEVWQGTRRVAKRLLLKRRAGELMALLLASPGYSLSFDQIADALWRDKELAAVRDAYHHATSACAVRSSRNSRTSFPPAMSSWKKGK